MNEFEQNNHSNAEIYTKNTATIRKAYKLLHGINLVGCLLLGIASFIWLIVMLNNSEEVLCLVPLGMIIVAGFSYGISSIYLQVIFGTCYDLRKIRMMFDKEKDAASVIVPNGVTHIESHAFDGYRNLTNVTVGSQVTSIDDNAFYGCNTLTSIIIPDRVDNIGKYAFYGCSNLASITIPSNVTRISKGVFKYCSSLSSITIPDSVTSIEEGAFNGCGSLKSITISKSVKNIGWNAFGGCGSFATVYYTGTEEDWLQITILTENDKLIFATRYYYSETQPTDDENLYWRYVDGVPTPW